ncbi:MAG: glycerophosphodiester phosphodiesterase [Ruminococcaceae bacterium]|nr:glycerophosphodiester phosphodiesterase [Oscillospiraceae bacterium]
MVILLWIVSILAFLALVWLLVLMPRMKTPAKMQELKQWRYAHRGYHNETLPENSLGAFRRAAKEGFGAELDVHLSKDGRLIVHHDESLKRLCGADVNICDLTAEELSYYRLNGTDEPIPHLEQVLAIFENKAPLVIELKTKGGNAPTLCDAVMKQLKSYKGLYCLESFDPRVLLHLKKHYPEVVRGQLSENYFRHNAVLHPVLKFLLHNLLLNFLTKPDFIAFHVLDWQDRSFTLCRRFYGTQVFGWTIRTKEEQALVEDNNGVIIFEQFDPR